MIVSAQHLPNKLETQDVVEPPQRAWARYPSGLLAPYTPREPPRDWEDEASIYHEQLHIPTARNPAPSEAKHQPPAE